MTYQLHQVIYLPCSLKIIKIPFGFLYQVPADQWLCPNCDDILDVIHISELDDLFTDIAHLDLPEGRRILSLQEGSSNLRRSGRISNTTNEPSTSSGPSHQRHSYAEDAPSTSRPRISRSSHSSRSQATTRRRTTGTHRRKYKRRRTKTVIIEYEVEENGKFPVTKTVKRRVKRRKVSNSSSHLDLFITNMVPILTVCLGNSRRASVSRVLRRGVRTYVPACARASPTCIWISGRKHLGGHRGAAACPRTGGRPASLLSVYSGIQISWTTFRRTSRKWQRAPASPSRLDPLRTYSANTDR